MVNFALTAHAVAMTRGRPRRVPKRTSQTNRLKEVRCQLGLTQEALSARAGISAPQISRYESGASSLLNDGAESLRAALNLSSAADLFAAPTVPSVRILGEVGAGAQVFHQDDHTEFVAGPPDLDDPIAVRVRGTSMMPVFREGDLLFAEMRQSVANDVVGHDCIVQVVDGPCLVKRVHRGGASGTFRLFSYETQDLSDDLQLAWAAPVRWVRR